MIVAIRGIDGAGKSTAVHNVVEALKTRGVDATGTKISLIANPAFRRYRELAQSSSMSIDGFIRRSMAVAETVRVVKEEILPAHLKGRIVVCDRYWKDTITYLRVRKIETAEAESILTELPREDIEVVVDVPIDVAKRRCRELGENWSDKTTQLITAVHSEFAEAIQVGGRITVDGTKPASVVCETIVQSIGRANERAHNTD